MWRHRRAKRLSCAVTSANASHWCHARRTGSSRILAFIRPLPAVRGIGGSESADGFSGRSQRMQSAERAGKAQPGERVRAVEPTPLLLDSAGAWTSLGTRT